MDKKKRNKIIIAVAVAIAVIGGVLAIVLNLTSIQIKATYAMMPKSITQQWYGEEITFYVRRNNDFDSKKQKESPLEAFEFYYYDKDGNEVNLGSDGSYIEGDANTMPSTLFLLSAMQKSNNLKSTYRPIIITVIVIIAVAVLIYIWYRLWCKSEEKQKQLKYKNKNKKSNKK